MLKYEHVKHTRVLKQKNFSFNGFHFIKEVQFQKVSAPIMRKEVRYIEEREMGEKPDNETHNKKIRENWSFVFKVSLHCDNYRRMTAAVSMATLFSP